MRKVFATIIGLTLMASASMADYRQVTTFAAGTNGTAWQNFAYDMIDGKMVVGTGSGTFYAVDLATGAKTTYNTGIADGMVSKVVKAADGNYYAELSGDNTSASTPGISGTHAIVKVNPTSGVATTLLQTNNNANTANNWAYAAIRGFTLGPDGVPYFIMDANNSKNAADLNTSRGYFGRVDLATGNVEFDQYTFGHGNQTGMGENFYYAGSGKFMEWRASTDSVLSSDMEWGVGRDYAMAANSSGWLPNKGWGCSDEESGLYAAAGRTNSNRAGLAFQMNSYHEVGTELYADGVQAHWWWMDAIPGTASSEGYRFGDIKVQNVRKDGAGNILADVTYGMSDAWGSGPISTANKSKILTATVLLNATGNTYSNQVLNFTATTLDASVKGIQGIEYVDGYQYVLTTQQDGSVALYTNAVPEPSSILAMASGLVGMAGFAIRRRRA